MSKTEFGIIELFWSKRKNNLQKIEQNSTILMHRCSHDRISINIFKDLPRLQTEFRNY